MTSPTDQPLPTAREIAELTARLRALTGRSPDVDPARAAAERAAFLADKDALIARITATHRNGDDADHLPPEDTAPPDDVDRSGWARAAADGHGRVAAKFDPADAYSAAEIAALAAAYARGDHTEVEQLQAGRPPLTPAPDIDEHDEAIEREFNELCERFPLPGDPGGPDPATSSYGPAWIDPDDYIDDGPIDATTATANPDIWDDQAAGLLTESECDRPARAVPSCLVEVDDAARREQLIRWHAEDHAAEESGVHCDGFAGGTYSALRRD